MYKQMSLSAVIVVGGFAALTLTVSLAHAHSGGRTNNPYCRNWLEGRTGIAVHKDKAKDRARRKWSYDAKRTYGYDYSGWQYAESTTKHYHCNHKAGTWRCRAVAYPCDWQAH